MPERRDPVRPLLGAATCFIIYWVVWNLLIPPIRFLGGEMVADTIPLLIAAALASTLGMMIFESRGLGDLGFSWKSGTARNLLTGLAFGALGALLLIVPAVLLGVARYQRIEHADVSLPAALFMPALLFCGAAGEEILFRGFMLQYLMRGWGPWAGIFTMGALFGALHSSNPGASPLGMLNTAGFGVLFGIALFRSHDLWLPIGMHFAWNTILPFLGADLSGLTIRVTEYRLVWRGGDLWSGGKYGPEASVAASAVLLVLFVALWKVPLRKGEAWLLDSPPDSE
ncbi:MAG TPA: type II CAAX endopeptidase family protein [Bryobacteraceae bacterium]|nr:type II CAAX endopeptidase family protein [Bryobacteraceae bacterium]